MPDTSTLHACNSAAPTLGKVGAGLKLKTQENLRDYNICIPISMIYGLMSGAILPAGRQE